MFVCWVFFYSIVFSFQLKIFLSFTVCLFVCLAVFYCNSLFRRISVATTSEFCVGGGGVSYSEPSWN